jgi:uncharacterized membrane protein
MERLVHNATHPGNWLPELRRVEAARPLQWLASGAQDMLRAPWVSSAYGLIFALLGYALLQISGDYPHFAMTYVAGFFLVGPFLAIGLYAIARRLEHNKPANLYHALTAWHRSGLATALFGAMIAIVLVFWIRFSWVFIGLVLAGGGNVSAVITPNLSTAQGLEFLAIYALSGGLLALVVFTLSAISLPMMFHRRIDIVTAMRTSIAAVRANKAAMTVWAASIVVISGIGMATYMIGFVIAFPLLGYATWHAYRDLVPRYAQ